MNKVLISVDLLNKLIQYLASKPFGEVNELIASIHKEANEPSPESGRVPNNRGLHTVKDKDIAKD
jgi:hypothetical protein